MRGLVCPTSPRNQLPLCELPTFFIESIPVIFWTSLMCSVYLTSPRYVTENLIGLSPWPIPSCKQYRGFGPCDLSLQLVPSCGHECNLHVSLQQVLVSSPIIELFSVLIFPPPFGQGGGQCFANISTCSLIMIIICSLWSFLSFLFIFLKKISIFVNKWKWNP